MPVPADLDQFILKAIYDSAIDAIVTIDEHGLIQTVNPATLKMFGYAPEELLGKNVSMLMPAPFQQEHDGYISRFLATRIPRIIGIGREVEAVRKDGLCFPIHLAVSEIVAGEVRLFVGYLRDLSLYKAAEQQMQSQLLINERLAAIGQTVSGLAHESRNALQRSHACLAELELDLEDMPSSQNLVRKVQRALDDLHQLLEEVRNYAAPIILERRQCSIEQLLREMWQNLLEVKGQSSAPAFELVVEPDFPVGCRVDANRFRQVFRNLLDNAWHACKEPKRILVKLSHHQPIDSGRGSSCRIEIIDSGDGVPEPNHEKIFAPFFTTKTKGTGLGLALTRRYIEAHGGRVYAAKNSEGETALATDLIIQGSASSGSRNSQVLSGARFVIEVPHC